MKLHILSGAEHPDSLEQATSRLHQIDTGRDTIGELGFEHARVLPNQQIMRGAGLMQAVARNSSSIAPGSDWQIETLRAAHP